MLGYPPKTDEERRFYHKRIYGTTQLPPRGTGQLVDMRYKNSMKPNLGSIELEGGISKILPYLIATFLTLNILYLTGVLKRKR